MSQSWVRGTMQSLVGVVWSLTGISTLNVSNQTIVQASNAVQ
jgi:hypothetical protein